MSVNTDASQSSTRKRPRPSSSSPSSPARHGDCNDLSALSEWQEKMRVLLRERRPDARARRRAVALRDPELYAEWLKAEKEGRKRQRRRERERARKGEQSRAQAKGEAMMVQNREEGGAQEEDGRDGATENASEADGKRKRGRSVEEQRKLWRDSRARSTARQSGAAIEDGRVTKREYAVPSATMARLPMLNRVKRRKRLGKRSGLLALTVEEVDVGTDVYENEAVWTYAVAEVLASVAGDAFSAQWKGDIVRAVRGICQKAEEQDWYVGFVKEQLEAIVQGLLNNQLLLIDGFLPEVFRSDHVDEVRKKMEPILRELRGCPCVQLQELPVALVAALVDTFDNLEAREASWWWKGENCRVVAQKAVKWCGRADAGTVGMVKRAFEVVVTTIRYISIVSKARLDDQDYPDVRDKLYITANEARRIVGMLEKMRWWKMVDELYGDLQLQYEAAVCMVELDEVIAEFCFVDGVEVIVSCVTKVMVELACMVRTVARIRSAADLFLKAMLFTTTAEPLRNLTASYCRDAAGGAFLADVIGAQGGNREKAVVAASSSGVVTTGDQSQEAGTGAASEDAETQEGLLDDGGESDADSDESIEALGKGEILKLIE